MASQNQPVSDSDRQRIEEEIAVALLLIYQGHRAAALAQLGAEVAAGDLPPEAVQKVTEFAADRAQKIQDGINSRIVGADDVAAVERSIADYNAGTLQPFMVSRMAHEGLVDAYRETPAPSPSGASGARVRVPPISADAMATASSQAQAHDWQWIRGSGSNEPDECGDAADLGPAPLDDILGITGGVPALHPSCQCDLYPL